MCFRNTKLKEGGCVLRNKRREKETTAPEDAAAVEHVAYSRGPGHGEEEMDPTDNREL